MLGKILLGTAALLAAGYAGYVLHDEIEKREADECICKNPGGDCNYCDFEPECYPEYETDDEEFDCTECEGCDEHIVCPASGNSHNNPWDTEPKDESQESEPEKEEEVTEDEKSSE